MGIDKFTIQSYWLNELGDLYNIWYDWFDQEEPARTIAKIINKFIPKKRPEIKILDCACGTGNPSIALKRMGFDVLSTDGSPKMLAKASENAQKTGVDLNLVDEPIVWSKLAHFFPKQDFDVIVCTGNAICHIPPEEVSTVIRQMALILKVGGLCIIDVKRYSERIRELHYEENKGWVERTVRIDSRNLPDGRTAQFITTLSYEGKDMPGRMYNIKLNLTYSDGRTHHYIFPVWAITNSMILDNMEDAGFDVLPLYPTPNPLEWEYDFCIGRKK